MSVDRVIRLWREGFSQKFIEKEVGLDFKSVTAILKKTPEYREHQRSIRLDYLIDHNKSHREERDYTLPLMAGVPVPITVEAEESVDGEPGCLVRGKVSKACRKRVHDIGPNGLPLDGFIRYLELSG